MPLQTTSACLFEPQACSTQAVVLLQFHADFRLKKAQTFLQYINNIHISEVIEANNFMKTPEDTFLLPHRLSPPITAPQQQLFSQGASSQTSATASTEHWEHKTLLAVQQYVQGGTSKHL